MALPGAGYLIGNQTVLPEIAKFIKSVNPDVIGLIEVDTGCIRSRNVNQAEKLASDLGMNTSYKTIRLEITKSAATDRAHAGQCLRGRRVCTVRNFTILTPASSA